MITVHSYPRLHFGLIDLGYVTASQYGGAGVILDCLPTVLHIDNNGEGIESDCPLDQYAIEDAKSVIRRFSEVTSVKPAHVHVVSMPPQHVGLGTKTSLLLNIATGLNSYHNTGLGIADLQSITNRGGTSGVGIHGFFLGGCIVDAGHKQLKNCPHTPSNHSYASRLPTLVSRYEFPSNWHITLILPDDKILDRDAELSFFQENTPIMQLEVLSAMSSVYHGIVPGVINNDLHLVRESLLAMHSGGFKSRELANHQGASSLYRQLSHLPSAVGMSSMGPLLYTIAEPHIQHDIIGVIESECNKANARIISVCHARNSGYTLQ